MLTHFPGPVDEQILGEGSLDGCRHGLAVWLEAHRHETMQALLGLFVRDDMPGKVKGKETDSFPTKSTDQKKDIALEGIDRFAVSGGKLFRTIIFSLIAVVCI